MDDEVKLFGGSWTVLGGLGKLRQALGQRVAGVIRERASARIEMYIEKTDLLNGGHFCYDHDIPHGQVSYSLGLL